MNVLIDRWLNMQWASPWWLLALILPTAWLGWSYWTQARRASIPLPGSDSFTFHGKSWRILLINTPLWLRWLALSLVVVALARPREMKGEDQVETESIDMMLALDISGSMNAMDFQPNRFVAAKQTGKEFIDLRPNDRIGLVVFSAQAFTQSPLTLDHQVLKLLLDGVQQGLIENGTAIGLGLATAVLRLKDSEAVSKVVILLTDGVNNRFEINPVDAMQLAKQLGIRVYTIGMGTNGEAEVPKTDFAGNTIIVREPVEIDEALLGEIATATGGKYYRATDLEALNQIYQEIDQLETTKMEVIKYVQYREWYWPLALAAFCLLLLEMLFRYAVLRVLPESSFEPLSSGATPIIRS